MAKLLLLSILAAVFAIPILSARDRNARRGFKRAMFAFFLYCIGYVLALKFLYLRLV